jgi:hypothetical protein
MTGEERHCIPPDQRKIKRPDSQAPPHIEILEISFRLLGIDENAGNQKSGQHEKQINSHPPIAEQPLRMKQRIFQADVVHHHDQNREAAYGIELRNSSLHFLRRLSPMGEYSRLRPWIISTGSFALRGRRIRSRTWGRV